MGCGVIAAPPSALMFSYVLRLDQFLSDQLHGTPKKIRGFFTALRMTAVEG
jgi:hypothetical protein